MPDAMMGLGTALPILGGVMGGQAQKDAAKTAAGAEMQAAQMSIAEQQRQFDAIKEMMAPYVGAGAPALGMQQNLLGMNGQQAQQDFYSNVQASPEYAAMIQQGENAMLQNASATGGLRGGNTQGALAQFRPQILNQLINQQYARLGGLAASGQNAAAMQGTAGQNFANQASAQYGNIGSAQAGAALAKGQVNANMWNLPAQAFGNAIGGGMFGSGGGGGFTPAAGTGAYNFNF